MSIVNAMTIQAMIPPLLLNSAFILRFKSNKLPRKNSNYFNTLSPSIPFVKGAL